MKTGQQPERNRGRPRSAHAGHGAPSRWLSSSRMARPSSLSPTTALGSRPPADGRARSRRRRMDVLGPRMASVNFADDRNSPLSGAAELRQSVCPVGRMRISLSVMRLSQGQCLNKCCYMLSDILLHILHSYTTPPCNPLFSLLISSLTRVIPAPNSPAKPMPAIKRQTPY